VARVVEALDGLGLGTRANRGGQEDVIAPDDGRTPADAWNVGLPADVLGLAPGFGQRRIVGNLAVVVAAEAGPVLRGRHNRGKSDDRETQQYPEAHRRREYTAPRLI